MDTVPQNESPIVLDPAIEPEHEPWIVENADGDPVDVWDAAIQYWGFAVARNFGQTLAYLKREFPQLPKNDLTLARLKQQAIRYNWAAKIDAVVYQFGDAFDRQDRASLISLRPKAIEVLRKGLDGELVMKTDNLMISAAREVLNRTGYSERLLEPLQPLPPPRDTAGGTTTDAALGRHARRLGRPAQ